MTPYLPTSFHIGGTCKKKSSVGFEKTKKLQKRLLITIFFKCRQKKQNPLKSLLFRKRDGNCIAALFLSTQQAVLAQTKSLLMHGEFGALTLTREAIRSLQGSRIPQRTRRQGCERVCTPCAQRQLRLTMPLPCIYFL